MNDLELVEAMIVRAQEDARKQGQVAVEVLRQAADRISAVAEGGDAAATALEVLRVVAWLVPNLELTGMLHRSDTVRILEARKAVLNA